MLTLSDEIIKRAESTIEALHAIIEGKEKNLRGYKRSYSTDGKLCGVCGRKLPGNAKKCHPCNNSDIYTNFCSLESRVASYFTAVRQAGLWPLTLVGRTLSVKKLTYSTQEMSASLRHDCAAGGDCPLKQEISDLARSSSRIQDIMPGIRLDWVRKCCE